MMKMTTLAVDAGKLLGESGMTVLIGLVVVFTVLLLLTMIFKLFGVVGGSLAGGKKEEASVPAPQKAVAAPVPVAKAPVVQAGINDEVVAAIAAAVAMMSADGKTYAVRRISRVSNGRSAWAAAGIAENTRSF